MKGQKKPSSIEGAFIVLYRQILFHVFLQTYDWNTVFSPYLHRSQVPTLDHPTDLDPAGFQK